jgi:hypothetical protein
MIHVINQLLIFLFNRKCSLDLFDLLNRGDNDFLVFNEFIPLCILLLSDFFWNLVSVLVVQLHLKFLLKLFNLIKSLVQSFRLLLDIHMGSQLQVQSCRTDSSNSTSFRNFTFVLDDLDIFALTQSSKQVSLLRYDFLISNNKGFSFDLWWKVDTRSDGSETSSGFVNDFEKIFDFLKVIG